MAFLVIEAEIAKTPAFLNKIHRSRRGAVLRGPFPFSNKCFCLIFT